MQLNNDIEGIYKLFDKPSIDDLSSFQINIEIDMDKIINTEVCI